MATLMLKTREIPLVYTVMEMKAIQEEIGPVNKAVSMMLGKNPDDKTDESFAGSTAHINVMSKMICILGNAGLEEAGEAPDLTEKKVLRGIKPAEMADAMTKCIEAMNEGMQSEIPEEEEDSPVDVTLEEMKKKEVKES